MGLKERYDRGKQALLTDPGITKQNRDLFREFFEFEEYKLKRTNHLPHLDDGCHRTLAGYLQRLRNANMWFANKPWKNLTKEDIKRVYDDLEEGRITNQRGLPFKDRASYYNKIFKSKPFRLAGKSELARDVIEFSTGRTEREVRFTTEDTFRTMVSVLSNPIHLLLFWLAWDIGENIGALLQLSKRDFVRQRNKQTHEAEYLVNLPRSKIKRSRKSRTEPTLYAETVRFADIVLEPLSLDGAVFEFGHRQAQKILHQVVNKTGAASMPNNDAVLWKDLRSGMACHLLKNAWTREEVDARLGHTPQSTALNAYINYLAIDREKPKKRLFDSSLEEVQNELEEAKRREKLTAERLKRQSEESRLLRQEMDNTKRLLQELQTTIRTVITPTRPA